MLGVRGVRGGLNATGQLRAPCGLPKAQTRETPNVFESLVSSEIGARAEEARGKGEALARLSDDLAQLQGEQGPAEAQRTKLIQENKVMGVAEGCEGGDTGACLLVGCHRVCRQQTLRRAGAAQCSSDMCRLPIGALWVPRLAACPSAAPPLAPPLPLASVALNPPLPSSPLFAVCCVQHRESAVKAQRATNARRDLKHSD